jgi:betaine lipid synthase
LNGRNGFIVPFIIRIPFYVWLGCKKDRDPNVHKRLDAIATESPYLKPSLADTELQVHSKAYDQAIINLEANLPLPSFLYQKRLWRIPYDPKLNKHAQFTNYIYAFTWEDPREDQKILNITNNDVMLVISSAGDNALSYAIESHPSRIHCVDLNPCQNHLLELKLAALVSLDYQDIWKLFGLGKHADFPTLLHEKLSPHLTSHALQFWGQNANNFNPKGRGLYETGYSGWALKLARWLFSTMNVSEEVKRMCSATTIEDQVKIWEDKVSL